MRRGLLLSLILLVGAAGMAQFRLETLAPYVPTPQFIVDKMLELAEVTAKDTVYDIGCGDCRIIITAALKYGAHGVGVDTDPERIKECAINIKKAGVEKLVTARLEDAFKVDLSPATVVTLYLLTSSNLQLRPKLTRELKPGTRIVSHAFTMGDWEPLKTQVITDDLHYSRTIYLWKADGKMRP